MTPEDFIASVVAAFYRKATVDVLIGYHFRHISDFAAHLPRIVGFWQIQLLGKSDHEFTPPLDVIRAHVPLKIHRGEVGRWVRLFEETLREHHPHDTHRLTERWQEKLGHFEQVFLQTPLLFPKV